MGQGTLSHEWGTGPPARDFSFPSVMPTGAQHWKSSAPEHPLATPTPPNHKLMAHISLCFNTSSVLFQ